MARNFSPNYHNKQIPGKQWKISSEMHRFKVSRNTYTTNTNKTSKQTWHLTSTLTFPAFFLPFSPL
jgi:hypothetical protein